MLIPQNRNNGKWFATSVLHAINKYGMISPGETLAVGLSGGKDSMTLLAVLNYLQRCSPLDFIMLGVHVRTADYGTEVIRSLCDTMEVEYVQVDLDFAQEAPRKSVCAVCSRLKRGALSRLLRDRGIRTLAYGHHADDVTETLMMNIVHNRQLSTLTPVVKYDDNPLQVIRPMVYLSERTVSSIHSKYGLPLLDYKCPWEDLNVRRAMKDALEQFGRQLDIGDLSSRVVSAMENVELVNLWDRLRDTGDFGKK